MMANSNLEKALEYFRDAEKLDPLNKEIFLNKGICYMQIVNNFLYRMTQIRQRKNLNNVLKLNLGKKWLKVI
jgi:hypothetical protein